MQNTYRNIQSLNNIAKPGLYHTGCVNIMSFTLDESAHTDNP